MKKESITVAQSVFSRVKAEFNVGAKRISKSEILEWTITYVEDGVQKTANKDTVGRKLRKLVEEGYLGAEYEKGQCYIVPFNGQKSIWIEEKGTPKPEIAPVERFHGAVRYEGRAVVFKDKNLYDNVIIRT